MEVSSSAARAKGHGGSYFWEPTRFGRVGAWIGRLLVVHCRMDPGCVRFPNLYQPYRPCLVTAAELIAGYLKQGSVKIGSATADVLVDQNPR